MKAVYMLYKGEKPLIMGTAKELAEQLNVKKETIYFYSSPAYHRRDKGKRIVAVKV